MKSKVLMLGMAILLVAPLANSQTNIQFMRVAGKAGLNVFETPKETDVKFDGLHVKVGGDFAIQFQGLTQKNDFDGDTLLDLADLSNNFNLPTANLNLDVQLEDGIRLHLRTYLSSKHHEEAWVKGGHIQFDNLDFIKDGFLDAVMEITTLRFGMDEINYGDAHFRRSDNAAAIYNPFVGNYIMDAFTTEPFAEVTVQSNGIIGLLGFTNGRLNQNPVPGDDGAVIFAKLGYDNQVNDDLRLRLTGSIYSSNDKGTRDYLYGGDRSGARYYRILEDINGGGSDFDPRFNPRYGYLTAFQINPFVKYKVLEFFGAFEMMSNGDSDVGGEFTQLVAELIYRIGDAEDVFIGGRFNDVSGNIADGADDQSINRINIGGGWFMTNNILVKAEYVMQKYEDAGWDGTKLQGLEFDGIVFEAVIGF